MTPPRDPPGLDPDDSDQIGPSGLKEEVRRELQQLSYPSKLRARLRRIDAVSPADRLFVMGCARSGTWLLAALMSTFADTEVVPHEVPVQWFGIYRGEARTLVLKRDARAYQRIEQIPRSIGIVCIVRHPFDVLTSHNPTTVVPYHVAPYRWLGEMAAVDYLIASERPRTALVRYEDLVADPDRVQASIGARFGLTAERPAGEFATSFAPSPAAEAAMHGMRPINDSSVGRFRRDPKDLEHLRRIRPRLGRTLDWVAERFGYDIEL